jgi:hypothetical protein
MHQFIHTYGVYIFPMFILVGACLVAKVSAPISHYR